MTECPSCGDTLVGCDVPEAMAHLSVCDTERGWRSFGLNPTRADRLYRQLTGDTPPEKPEFERMVHYLHCGTPTETES